MYLHVNIYLFIYFSNKTRIKTGCEITSDQDRMSRKQRQIPPLELRDPSELIHRVEEM